MLDERDEAIRQQRAALFAQHTTPQVGDFVRFADGVTRRISYVWKEEPAIQTSRGGSWHIAGSYASFSGGLYPAIPRSTLTLEPERRDGVFWFFHHDHACAHNGVDCMIPCRVWTCSEVSRD